MSKSQQILITGGAGFIGSNLANRLIEQGHRVRIFDNMSRSGCASNVEWLRNNYGDNGFELIQGDLCDFDQLLHAAKGVERVYHLAGQVAVTSSVKKPRNDFMDNALGTFNALEAARLAGSDPIFVYSSSNKVYGGMEDVKIVEENSRYKYAYLSYGVSESQPLDFHSPYGCSKGAGDQYVRDYARIYGMKTVVARQSCIYGYRQFGIEDQGWVAWFIIAALKDRAISIYGNGKQVRDVLFVDDLIDFYEAVVENIENAAGQIFNIGGGPKNTMSIWIEFSSLLEELIGHSIHVKFSGWRPGDQLVYISDIRKAEIELGWRPKISVRQGVETLYKWVQENLCLFSHI